MSSQVQIELLLFTTVRDVLAPHKPITEDTSGLVHRLITRLVDDGTLAPIDVDEEEYRRLKGEVESGLARSQVANARIDCTNPLAMRTGRRVVEEYYEKGYPAELKANGALQVRHPQAG